MMFHMFGHRAFSVAGAAAYGTRYQTMFEIRRVLLPVFIMIWKLFFSRYTSVYTALRLCDTDIDKWKML